MVGGDRRAQLDDALRKVVADDFRDWVGVLRVGGMWAARSWDWDGDVGGDLDILDAKWHDSLRVAHED